MTRPSAIAVTRITAAITAMLVMLAAGVWAYFAIGSARQERQQVANALFDEAAWEVERTLARSRLPKTDFFCKVGEIKIVMASGGCASRTGALVLASTEGKIYLDGGGLGGHFVQGRFRDRYQAPLDAATVLRLREAATKWVSEGESMSVSECGMPCFWRSSMVCVDGKRRSVYAGGFGTEVDDGHDTLYGLLSVRPGRNPAAEMALCM